MRHVGGRRILAANPPAMQTAVTATEPTLERVFLGLTGHALRD